MTILTGTQKNYQHRTVLAAAVGIALGFACLAAQAVADAPALLPTPKRLALSGGAMPLTPASRIVAADARLDPIATVLAGEIQRATGLALKTASGNGNPGDIVLRINPNLRAEEDILAVQDQKVRPTRDFAHEITVTDKAVVEGWDYRAVCEGTATVLQALGTQKEKPQIPCMKIKDWPHADYTGVMVDVARQRIPIDALKAVVEACRLWKIRYCHLHLADDEAFTFPSKLLPRLGTKNVAKHEGEVPRVYDLDELKELVAYADARGVTLVPELNLPTRCDAMCRAMPEVFAGAKMLNITNDEMYKSLDGLVGEICEVFKSSPYFHIGGDDGPGYFYEMEELPATRKYMQDKGMKEFKEVVFQHQARMVEMIAKRGKKTLAWEGSTLLDPRQKDDLIIMCWVPYPTSSDYLKRGFTVITVPWVRGPALQNWTITNCNGCNLTLTDRILGSSLTMWEMSASAVVSDFLGGDLNGSSAEGYIQSLGDAAEGAWSPRLKPPAAEHQKGLAATRALLTALALPVRIESKNIGYRGWPVRGCDYFSGMVEVSLAAVGGPGGGEIRYALDGSEPTSASPLYGAPLTLDETTTVHAALFRDGRQIGHVARRHFQILGGDGTIQNWGVAGPYSIPGKSGLELFDVVFDPEKDVKVNWRPYTGGVVKFGAISGIGGDQRVAYMRTEVWSPKAQQARLSVASDDGVKVFLNGKVVHAINVVRPAFMPDVLDVPLEKGWNKLMLKVTNASEGWEAWVKLQNVDGGPLGKMRVKAE